MARDREETSAMLQRATACRVEGQFAKLLQNSGTAIGKDVTAFLEEGIGATPVLLAVRAVEGMSALKPSTLLRINGTATGRAAMELPREDCGVILVRLDVHPVREKSAPNELI